MVSDEVIVAAIQEHLHCVFRDAGYAWHQVAGTSVGRFGSREYLTSTDEVSDHEKGSDLDLYVAGCTDEMVHQGIDLLRALGCRLLRAGVASNEKRTQPIVAECAQTLKWTTKYKGRTIDTSVLLADAITVCGARSATRCAASLLLSKPEWRMVIRELLAELQAVGLLNPHGRDGKVHQHLKTVSFTLLCCGILSSGEWESSTASSLRVKLLASIAQFDASKSVVITHWPGAGGERCTVWVERRRAQSPDALLILVNGRNSANRLTQPSWFALQHACAQKSSLPKESICDSIQLPALFHVAIPIRFELSYVQHARLQVVDPASWDSRKDEYVVVTLTPCQRDGDEDKYLLVVLTDTGNQTSCSVEGYKQIMYFTWRSD